MIAAALMGIYLFVVGFTYQLALPGRKLTFPADHYSHPDFKTEWWYYTGHLETDSGKKYGYQVTFFRFGVRDRQTESKDPPLFTDLYMAHDRYLVWNEDWKVEGDERNHLIQVNNRGTRLRLSLKAVKAPSLHGENGLSQKGEGEGRASYYYSLTRMQAEGELAIDGKNEKVRGLSWMDHEFGSNQLGEDQVGWDWFSIQLDNNTELMLYLMRRKDGSVDPYSSGTLVSANGATKPINLRDYRVEVLDRWKSQKSGANYPMKWKVTIPSEEIELDILPAFHDQELITNRSTRVTYWEGAVGIKGKFRNKPVTGDGYVEMTGYAGKLNI